MKKLLLILGIIISFKSFAAIELNYEENNTTPVIKSGVAQAKKNIQTTFIYNQNDMYKIYTREGFLTTIFLNPDEKIVYLAGGDTARWAIDQGETGTEKGGMQTVVVIKAFYEGLKTNLIINTTKRSYNFYLYSAKDWYNPVVKFLYPNEGLALIKQQNENNIETTLVNLNNLNNNYNWNNKKYDWAPLQVFDDGHKTYIMMKPIIENYEAPALFVKDSQTGKIAIVRYRMKNNCFIVDRLFNQAVLKLGKKEIIIKRNGSFIKNPGDYYPVTM